MAEINTPQQTAVGKTIRNLITREDEHGRAVVIMMQFTDGSCFEFVTPRSSRMLNQVNRKQDDSFKQQCLQMVPQMNLFAQAS